MKKILIFDTAIATTNIGDEIIMDGCREGLKEILDSALCFRLGTHIENFSPIKMVRNWKLKALCDDADYKFVFGTNCLVDKLGILSQWQLNNFNKKMYKDVILVGVGRVCDFEMPNKHTLKIYKSIFSKKYKHSVRDEQTKELLERMGFKAINTGCPTLWSFTKEKCKKIPQKKASKCILSVSGYVKQLNREKDQIMIDTIRKNYDKCYAWIQTYKDENYLKSLANTDDIECIYSLNKFKELLNKGDIDYVGTRLHGGVFALQHNCRTIIISIDERARGFHESNNIPILERDEIDKLDDLINSNIKTNIKVDYAAINEFVSQFKV